MKSNGILSDRFRRTAHFEPSMQTIILLMLKLNGFSSTEAMNEQIKNREDFTVMGA